MTQRPVRRRLSDAITVERTNVNEFILNASSIRPSQLFAGRHFRVPDGQRGYRGGLKAVERTLGHRRDPAIQGVDGFEAVRLWHCYRRGDRQALRKLILYHLTDVVNMVELVETTVRLKQPQLAFPGEITAHAPFATRKFHTGSLGTWITETLSSWNLA